jgi:hypothetical protein
MSNANQIIFDQEKLNEIRRETERRMAETRKEILDKVNARKDAHREGHLDEDRAAEIWRETDEKRLREYKEHAQRQVDQEKRERIAKADQEKRDQQRRDDQRSEDIRAQTREKMRAETERRVKDALKDHVKNRTKEKPDEKAEDKQEHAEGQRQDRQAKPEPKPTQAQAPAQQQDRIMAGASQGPVMTPRMMNDPLAMAAAMDHPGLTDDQKLIMARAGYVVGEGWHNREAERKEAMMQAERQKRDDLRARYAEREPAQAQRQREFKADHFENLFSPKTPEREPQVKEKDYDQREAEAGDDRTAQQDQASTQDTSSREQTEPEDRPWYQRDDLDRSDDLTQDQVKDQERSR